MRFMLAGQLVVLLLLSSATCLHLKEEEVRDLLWRPQEIQAVLDAEAKVDISGLPEPGNYRFNFVLPQPSFVDFRKNTLSSGISLLNRATISLERMDDWNPNLFVLKVGEKWVKFSEYSNMLVENKKDATNFFVFGRKMDRLEGFGFITPQGKQLGIDGWPSSPLLRLVNRNDKEFFVLTKA